MQSRSDEKEGPGIIGRWEQLAMDRHRRDRKDWRSRQVRALVAAVASGDQLERAADSYGRSRCEAGWLLSEVLDDIEDLLTTVAGFSEEGARWQLIRAAVAGWSEQVVSSVIAAPFRDAITGLPTIGHLILAAEVLYQRSPAVPIPASHSLLLVKVRSRNGLVRARLLMELSARVCDPSGAARVVVALDNVGIVALVENSASDYAWAMTIADGDDLSVSIEPMPPGIEELEARLAGQLVHARGLGGPL
ncbi:hypothetical protein [Aquihabitans sp. McL0605]|uniref:hypothetical protein n=1 Tax=Aquihabitans sp. McL0605 TaxID=3415671 RepID=UPI003CEA38A2